MSEPTVKGMFEEMDRLGAGHMAIVSRDGQGNAVAAAVFLKGEGTEEILNAVEEIYDRQDREAHAALEGSE